MTYITGKMLEHTISWKVLQIFAHWYSNDHYDVGYTLIYFVTRSNLVSGLSYELMELVGDFVAKANKCCEINEY